MLPYPTDTTLRRQDLVRELRAKDHFRKLTLKDLDAGVRWPVFAAVWGSKRCAAFREAYDVRGFADFIAADRQRRDHAAIPGPRSRLDRLTRLYERAGVAPSPAKARRAATHTTAQEAADGLVASARDDGHGRILIDPAILLGAITRDATTEHVVFARYGKVLAVPRVALANIARGLRGVGPVECFLDTWREDLRLCFRWREGKGGLNVRAEDTWDERRHGAETLVITLPALAVATAALAAE